MDSARYWRAVKRTAEAKEYCGQHDVTEGITTIEAQGLRLMFYRGSARISSENLCREVGITPGTLRSWESGRTSIRCSVLPDLCKTLGIEPNDIISPMSDKAPHMKAIMQTCREVKQNDMALATLTNQLIERRKELSLTREKLAKRAGVCPSDISRYEQDGYRVRPIVLLRIYTALLMYYDYIQGQWIGGI